MPAKTLMPCACCGCSPFVQCSVVDLPARHPSSPVRTARLASFLMVALQTPCRNENKLAFPLVSDSHEAFVLDHASHTRLLCAGVMLNRIGTWPSGTLADTTFPETAIVSTAREHWDPRRMHPIRIHHLMAGLSFLWRKGRRPPRPGPVSANSPSPLFQLTALQA